MKKESETLELKKSLAQLREGIISLSAMLNKHQRGEVYFGINDEGKVCGQTIGERTIADIIRTIRSHLKPLPLVLSVEKEEDGGNSIIHVIVRGDDTPYSAYDRYYIRINDADVIMDAYQLQKYFENKTNTYLKWEETPTKYGVEDIDEDLLIQYFRDANHIGRMDYIYRNPMEALKKLGLLTGENRLNNAGYYLFSASRPLTIKMACYPTDSRIDFGELKEFKGNIFECIHEALLYITNHITFKSVIRGVQRAEIPEIPLSAVREIVINSFTHCSYGREGDYNQYSIYRSYVKSLSQRQETTVNDGPSTL